MKHPINRRAWFKSTALLAGGLVLGNRVYAEYTDALLSTTFTPSAKMPPGFTEMKARLTSNENPFGPSEKAREMMINAIQDSWMYAKVGKGELKKTLSAMWGVSEEHIMLGAGSTEILMAAAQHYGKAGNKILAADLTYMSLIRRACHDYGAALATVPLTRAYDYDFDPMLDAVTADINLVYICNPNNPSGVKADVAQLKGFCEAAAAKKPVFVDEAYLDFQENPEAESMVDLVRKGKNVIVARTFSKVHALAGMRIGYAIALPETIEALKKFGTDGNGISRPGVLGAVATLKDAEFMQYSRQMTKASKDMLYQMLTDNGYEYIPSETNFVLFPIRMDGERFKVEMLKRGVGLKSVHYRNQHYCRVSIGTKKDMALFAEAFEQIS